jgi:hypothetical protein
MSGKVSTVQTARSGERHFGKAPMLAEHRARRAGHGFMQQSNGAGLAAQRCEWPRQYDCSHALFALSFSMQEYAMNEEEFNISMRKFLKMVGVSSQREIEHALARALADKSISGNEHFPAKVTLEVAGLKLKVDFNGEIRLE